jgi:molybdopterin synthase catalytic subunit
MVTDTIEIQTADFDLATEYEALSSCYSTGAVVTFVGKVRDFNQGDNVSGLTLEHYPGMTEKSLAKILIEAESRWSIQGVKVIHRIGELALGDQIVFVGVASAHRGDAFKACEFIMDYLKTQAPFWKKEATEAGSHWVDARYTDTTAADRWK